MTSLSTIMASESDGLAMENLEALEAGIERIDAQFGELAKTMQSSGAISRDMTKLFQNEMKSAFRDLVFEGAKLSEVLRDMAVSISNKAFSQAMNPVIDMVGNAAGAGLGNLVGAIMPFTMSAFSDGLPKFANGGIVDRSTRFRSPSGDGVLGENGPEAILPLSRGVDGRLGLRGAQNNTNVTIQFETASIDGFRKSKGQLMTMTKRMVSGR